MLCEGRSLSMVFGHDSPALQADLLLSWSTVQQGTLLRACICVCTRCTVEGSQLLSHCIALALGCFGLVTEKAVCRREVSAGVAMALQADETVVWLGSAASNVNPKREEEEMNNGGITFGLCHQSWDYKSKSTAAASESPSAYFHVKPQTSGACRCATLALDSCATCKSRKVACCQVQAFGILCLSE